MSAPSGASAGPSRGFVLLAVLGAVLIVAALAFAMLFTASLDAMAARARQAAVVSREALEAALALASAEVWHEHGAAGGAPQVGTEHGPWPELGVHATVALELVEQDGEPLVVRLTATLSNEPARAPERLVLQIRPELVTLRRH